MFTLLALLCQERKEERKTERAEKKNLGTTSPFCSLGKDILWVYLWLHRHLLFSGKKVWV
jgi:hypothetical protein